MALDVIVTSDRLKNDPGGRALVNHLRERQSDLALTDAVLYYDFPTYADYDTVAHKPDALLLSPQHGVVAIRIATDASKAQWTSYDESLVQFSSILYGRLLKSKIL